MTHFLRDFHFLSLWVLSWNVNWDFPVVIVINTKRRTWIYTYKDTRTHRENKRTFSLFIFYLHDFLNDQKQGEVFVFSKCIFYQNKISYFMFAVNHLPSIGSNWSWTLMYLFLICRGSASQYFLVLPWRILNL